MCHMIPQSKPGICQGSMRSQHIRGTTTTPVPALQLVAPVLRFFQDALPYPGPAHGALLFPDPFNDASLASNPSIDIGPPGANIVADDNSTKKGNRFCFSAFADKHTGTLYNDLTSSFPFMSLDKNVCYLIVYQRQMWYWPYSFANLEDTTIFEGYRKQFKFLASKGHNIQINHHGQSSKQTD
jgi:hypothetical protein